MFRPVQFAAYGSSYLFQLGISNTFVSFNPQTEQFQMGHYAGGNEFLTEKQLLEMFQTHGIDFILEANKCSYINNMISLGEYNLATDTSGWKKLPDKSRRRTKGLNPILIRDNSFHYF